MYATTKGSAKEGRALVEGPLALPKGGDKKGDLNTASCEGENLVLNFMIEDGFMELWPSVDLRPLVLTFVVFNPTLCLGEPI